MARYWSTKLYTVQRENGTYEDFGGVRNQMWVSRFVERERERERIAEKTK